MTEWNVVGVLIALFGFGAAVITPILKLNSTIIRLSVTLDTLSSELEKQAEKNSKSQARLWEHEEKQDQQLEEHEHRIYALEGDKK